MKFRRIDDYYRIRTALADISRGESHCGLCYKASCEHKNIERIDYEDAIASLGVWAEVALQEYEAPYLQVGEVAVYPAWPEPVDSPSPYQPYRVYPKIKGGIFGAIVSYGDVIGYNPDLTENEYLSKVGRRVARFGNGMYWGYGFRNDFYVIKLFRDEWRDIRRKTLPSQDVSGIVIPDFEVDFEIDGYHFLPRLVTSNDSFQRRYFEI